MISYKRSSHGLTGQLSYTYSHSLDMISNGGVGETFNSGSLTFQLTPALGPGNLNYSNSDYDIRNNLLGDLVYEEPFKTSNPIVNSLVGGWIVGVKTYARSGEPYSITNGGVLGNFRNLGTQLMPDLASGVTRSSLINGASSNPHKCADTDCLDTPANIAAGVTAAQFTPFGNQADFGNLRRNSLAGPHYVNSDVSLSKKLLTREGITLSIGANAYNVFNHANFANPVGDISLGSFRSDPEYGCCADQPLWIVPGSCCYSAAIAGSRTDYLLTHLTSWKPTWKGRPEQGALSAFGKDGRCKVPKCR